MKKVCSCWCRRRREKTIVRLMMMMMMMMMILIATTHRVCFTLFAVLYGVYESKSCCCRCHRRGCCCCCCCCCSCCCAVVQLVAAVGSGGGGDGVGAHPMRPCWSMMHALSRTEGCNGSQEAITIFQPTFLPVAFADLLSWIQFAVGLVFFQTLRVVGNRI